MKRLVATLGAFGLISAVVSVLGVSSATGFASVSTAYACGNTSCTGGGGNGGHQDGEDKGGNGGHQDGENKGGNGGHQDGENNGNNEESNDSDTPDRDDMKSDGSLDQNCNYCKKHPGDPRCKKHTPPPTNVPEVPMGGLLLGSLSTVATAFGLIAGRRRTSEI